MNLAHRSYISTAQGTRQVASDYREGEAIGFVFKRGLQATEWPCNNGLGCKPARWLMDEVRSRKAWGAICLLSAPDIGCCQYRFCC
jgi:hypothetical protein